MYIALPRATSKCPAAIYPRIRVEHAGRKGKVIKRPVYIYANPPSSPFPLILNHCDRTGMMPLDYARSYCLDCVPVYHYTCVYVTFYVFGS